jgi:hypothetical protein
LIGRGFMRNLTPKIAILAGSLALASRAAAVLNDAPPESHFSYKDAHGKPQSVTVITKFYPAKIQHPLAHTDSKVNPKLMRAATLAEERAHAHSTERCWHYVKEALLSAGAVSSYPKTAYAKEAGDELVRSYGFKRLAIRDPYAAPVGAVLVYGARREAGHVEIRTRDGFVSDFKSRIPSPRPLIGVYAKS